MVTLITEKLQDQTLEEISATDTILGGQPRNNRKERPNIDTVRRTARLQHRRTLTSRTPRSDACAQDGSKLGELASSFLTTRCHSYPPAKKRLCRSLSDPYKDCENRSTWRPEPSAIWTPVKPRKIDRTKKPLGARSLDFSSRETFAWSTPPESPIPRPVSANSTLEDSKFFPLRLINEERDGSQLETIVNCGQNGECDNLSATMPRRSHSHPSFSHISNSGLKRRLSEIDIPRPALDFDKMKARSFANKNMEKRSLKSPKYSSKRHPSLSPKNVNTAKQEKTMLMTTMPNDFGLSLLITPTASPTADVKTFEDSKIGHTKDENANKKSTLSRDYSYLKTENIMVDMELDLKLIEEDGTLNNPMHSTMFFT